MQQAQEAGDHAGLAGNGMLTTVALPCEHLRKWWVTMMGTNEGALILLPEAFAEFPPRRQQCEQRQGLVRA